MDDKPVDLFDIESLDSLVRQELREPKVVSLNDFKIPVFKLPSNSVTITVNLPSEKYEKHIRSAIEPVGEIAEAKGYSGNFFTALYEAVKNAHEHGNKKDENKHVLINHKIDDESAKIAIMDQGGVLEPDFIPFIIAHREIDIKEKFLNYYQFSGKQKPRSSNLGTGTSFMHAYADKVQYFKSSSGGLVVLLTKKKSQ